MGRGRVGGPVGGANMGGGQHRRGKTGRGGTSTSEEGSGGGDQHGREGHGRGRTDGCIMHRVHTSNDERKDHYQILTLDFKAIAMTCTLNFWVLKRINTIFHEFVVTNFNLLINPLHNFFKMIEGSNQRKTFKSSP
jgi:hypothetical protein